MKINNQRKRNYKKKHMIQILSSDAFKDKTTNEIELIAERNIQLYDKLQ